MGYINNYNYNTLIIIDSKNNETIGKVLLDIEDIPKVQKYHWRLNEKGYVIASIKGHKTIRIHNLILERDTSNQKITCDHINRNKWMAYIKKDNKMKTIGYFNTEKEAKQARSLYCENQ